MADICILGTGGTLPKPTRHLSSVMIRHNGHSVLFDCGEGTQIALKKAGFNFKPIDIICISHFHADHISGLPGFLLTMGNEGREAPVKILIPYGGAAIVRSLLSIAPDIRFSIEITEVNGTDDRPVRFADNAEIRVANAEHSVPCVAYSLYIHRGGKFNIEKATANCVPQKLWNKIRREGNVSYEGRSYTTDDIMDEERQGLKFTYITDTRPCLHFTDFANGSDVLICEGMFADNEKLSRAETTKHMMFSEAAVIAKNSFSRRLILTHFSPSLPEPEEYIEEARKIFPDSVCGTDGMTFSVNFEER